MICRPIGIAKWAQAVTGIDLTTLVAGTVPDSRVLLCTDSWHRRYDLLLAPDDFDDKALAIEIALLIEADVEQHARVVFGGYFRAVQGRSQSLGIEFTDLLSDRLDDVDG